MNPETPRTDAARIDNADLHDQGFGKSNFVSADDMAQLERELAAMTAERDALKAKVGTTRKRFE